MRIKKSAYFISESIENNFLNINKIGPSFFDDIVENPKYFKDNKDISFELKYITLDDFFNYLKPDAREAKYIIRENVEYIKKQMLAGVKYNTPFIEIYRDSNRVEHEGRHRMIAATELGQLKIPVYIFNRP